MAKTKKKELLANKFFKPFNSDKCSSSNSIKIEKMLSDQENTEAVLRCMVYSVVDECKTEDINVNNAVPLYYGAKCYLEGEAQEKNDGEAQTIFEKAGLWKEELLPK
mmetsp:Transcript_13529/g.17817  ORF Transcript_13529/g.17817 Transcript_13529/m.17817 type:complete len:107 (-) Transcript_13529:387-707(-)